MKHDSSLTAVPKTVDSTEISGPKSPPTNVRYWVLAILCAAAAIAYTQRYAINFLNGRMRHDLELSKSEMGVVMWGFFAAYGILQVPAGRMGDRWGVRKALALYAVAWSILTGLTSLAIGLWSLLIVWSLMGAAQAGLFPCAMIAARDWLPATRRALASGLFACFMNVGGAIAPIAGQSLLDEGLSWRGVFTVLSLPGLAWAAVYLYWFRDRPAQHAKVNAAELELIADAGTLTPAIDRAEGVPWGNLLTSPMMWLICVQQFFRAAAQIFFGTWFGTFLVESPGITESETAWLTSVPLVVLIVGSVVGGIISDWLLAATGSRRVARQGLSVVNLLLCAALFGAACLVEDSHLRVALIGVACAAMAIGGVSAYAITMDMGGAHVATVFSLMNMSGSIGAALFPLYAGWLIDFTDNWNYVLLSIAIIYLAAAACWALLDPRGTVFDGSSAHAGASEIRKG